MKNKKWFKNLSRLGWLIYWSTGLCRPQILQTETDQKYSLLLFLATKTITDKYYGTAIIWGLSFKFFIKII